MPSVVHVVTTDAFAGVERYVCNTATELSRRGWDVAVVGGHPRHMREALAAHAAWLPGATPIEALRSLTKLGRQDVCHAHMTIGEAVAIASEPLHRAAKVSTRHFAARRGSTLVGRALAPVISVRLDRQIAVSDFVAERIERRPDAVVRSGIAPLSYVWQRSSRVVLVLQRLEREKDTLTALRAWRRSRMLEEGWSLRIVGDGAERMKLESWVAANRLPGVVFAGWSSDVRSELAGAGMLFAPARADSLGFSVLEAMSAGVPVVASAAGGHLETVARLPDAPLFPPGDAERAAVALRSLVSDARRRALSSAGRELVLAEFTITPHVDRLLTEYEAVLHRRRKLAASPKRRTNVSLRPRGRRNDDRDSLRGLVVCSLEAWDGVWRRNQFFVDILLRRNPQLRVLFVEPPADPLFDLWNRRSPELPRVRSLRADGRLRAFRPLKTLPRKAGPITDLLLRGEVEAVARRMGLSNPILWINDVTYAPLGMRMRWPSVYDVTDDWLHAPFTLRELERLRHLDEFAVRHADEVVVCSPALAASRGAKRDVSLIGNAVDAAHFRRPRARPEDLPAPPVASYVGSLHESRIDVELVVEVARSLTHVNLAFVGPNALTPESQAALDVLPNVFLLGPRPYDDVPAYLQHSDAVIIPHRICAFTDSLDPIKVYECLAVDTPAVATRVAGFRDHDDVLHVVDRDAFTQRVADLLSEPRRNGKNVAAPSWEQRAVAFEAVLQRAADAAAARVAMADRP
jgi:glycosyltransferase involved in cell wall biosynthesis